MQIVIRDQVSLASKTVNEDRVGAAGNFAWVIDGATDVLEERILPGASDASWFAGALDQAFFRAVGRAEDRETALEVFAAEAIEDVRVRFENTCLRPLCKAYEQPSAAGVVIGLASGQLSYYALGDCALLALPGRGGTQDLLNEAGMREADREVRTAAAALAPGPQNAREGIRSELMPMLRASRDKLNQPHGYGIFSITPPPEKFIKSGAVYVQPGDRFLLASDGFMRLVDIYGAYDLAAFGAAISANGVMPLMQELRQIEQDEQTATEHPQAKALDDATALTIEVIPV